jgi:hypothetical protein
MFLHSTKELLMGICPLDKVKMRPLLHINYIILSHFVFQAPKHFRKFR